MKKLTLIGLNELNFDFVKYYINQGKLPNFKTLLTNNKLIETISEKEHKLLEPWIQWTTIHTGKSFQEHKVFRLGDIVNFKNLNQIFEKIEDKGFSVGSISAFNADNRLKKSSFFIPDPWTKTKVSGNKLIKSLSKAIDQMVNDNSSGSLKLKSIIILLISFIKYIPINSYLNFFKLFLKRKKPGIKAVILDNLLGEIFVTLNNIYRPDFSNLFLNSSAHIQHHYMFNSKAYTGPLVNPEWYCKKEYDPLIEILNVYDNLLGKILKNSSKVIVLTGLHQQPHNHLTYYWRLNKHEFFAKLIGVKFREILPRMSRDFLINFDSETECKKALKIFDSYMMKKDNCKLFNVDNRGKSLFLELIYSKEINSDDSVYSTISGKEIKKFKDYISFVAIKNGEHNGLGYMCSNFDLKIDKSQIKLHNVSAIIENQFN